MALAGCGPGEGSGAPPGAAPRKAEPAPVARAAAPSITPSPAPAPAPPPSAAPPGSAATRDTAPWPAVQEVLDAFAATAPVPFSVVAVDLDTGRRAARLDRRQVLSASLYKLFAAEELLRRVAAGTLRREAPSGDRRGRSVGECVRMMIVVSDDDCGVAGLRMVGRQAFDAALKREGYPDTSLGSPQRTTASDVARFLERLRGRAGAGDPTATELYDLLRRQSVKDRLPAGLPPGTPVAHKTGDRTAWAHDAGLVTAADGREVAVVVLSGPWPSPCCHAERPGPAERAAFGAIADLGGRIMAAAGGRRPHQGLRQ